MRDPRRRNAMVVSCAGRGNIPDYVLFCTQLGLTHLAVMDSDAQTPDAHASAQAVRDAVSKHPDATLLEFPVDLKTTFGVTKPHVVGPRGCQARSRPYPLLPSLARCQTRYWATQRSWPPPRQSGILLSYGA
jgi:hypothetical protein